MAAEDPRDRPMPSSLDNDYVDNEPRLNKIVRKLREEPLVPVGVILTTIALLNAARATRRGDREMAQRMFRARVAAQGFTVLAMVAGGMYYSRDRQSAAELRKVKAQREAEEKRVRWIKELEARDEENKELEKQTKLRRARRAAARAAARATGAGSEVHEAAKEVEKSMEKAEQAASSSWTSRLWSAGKKQGNTEAAGRDDGETREAANAAHKTRQRSEDLAGGVMAETRQDLEPKRK